MNDKNIHIHNHNDVLDDINRQLNRISEIENKELAITKEHKSRWEKLVKKNFSKIKKQRY